MKGPFRPGGVGWASGVGVWEVPNLDLLGQDFLGVGTGACDHGPGS